MQVNGHPNGGARVPRLRPSPQPPHMQQQRSATNDTDWLMTSWKSFLMILIATVILSLPILSKASPTPSETSLSCVAGCIESSAVVAGCAQNDVACGCRIGFGTDTLIQHEIFRCLDYCSLDLDGYYEYATTICGGIPAVVLSKASTIADASTSDSLIARDETAPSCAIGCIESSALVAGCAQNDIACRCRIGFGPDATIRDEIFGCMSRCETLDLDGYYEYATTVCQIDKAPVQRDETITPEAVRAVEDTVATTTTANRWGQISSPTSFPNVPDEAFIAPPRTPNQKDGMSLPAKLAIGIVIPVFVLVCIWVAMKQLKKRKAEKAKKLAPIGGTDQDTESGVGGHKAELPAAVVMKEEEKAVKKAKKEQEKADKRPFWQRKTPEQNEEVELEARVRERYDTQTRAIELEQGTGVGGAAVLPASQYYNQNQVYSPPPQGVAELYTPGAYPSGPHTEMDGQSPRDLHELNSAPISQVASPAPTYTTNPPASPQQNISRALGGTSPREESMAGALSTEEAGLPQPSPLAGPVPAALDLYPQTAESDKAAIVEEERRLAAKRATIAERKRLAEEEEQLEREEEALRRKKAAKGGN